MIRYALACDRDHAFESWFPSAAAYDEQAARGLVSCPSCGSPRVEKRVMAPAIARSDKASSPPPAAEPPEAQVLLSERDRHLRAFLVALREHVTRNAEHVGERFAEEARKIHHGEEGERPIYGEASAEEVRALLEEGIEIAPLPPAPGDRN
jgi:hypothetical protein